MTTRAQNNNPRYVTGVFPTYATPTEVIQTVDTKISEAYKTLFDGTGAGAEMRGWMNWPEQYIVSDEYDRLKKTAEKIRKNSDVVIVIGIGGSYLTPKAVISAVYGEYYNEVAAAKQLPRIYFAGCNLSPDNIQYIYNAMDIGEVSIIYISKSGGTMEPALSFRLLYDKLVGEYGKEEADRRVYAVTDASKGILKSMADANGWESFVIPDEIGGRYSGFTACGLLPLAVAGIDTDRLLNGAIQAMQDMKEDAAYSFAIQYASWRFTFYLQNIFVEFLATDTPYMSFFAEWQKQLFGESEGKDGKGILPTSGVFPTDLHSLGQYLQEGQRSQLMETFITSVSKAEVTIPETELDDNLQKFAGKSFSQAKAAAMDGAFQAHSSGGNPCCQIVVQSSTESLGYFMHSLFYACAISAYAMGVNPFNQPGVEAHKQAMKSSTCWDDE